MSDSGLILSGEIRSLSLLGGKGLSMTVLLALGSCPLMLVIACIREVAGLSPQKQQVLH